MMIYLMVQYDLITAFQLSIATRSQLRKTKEIRAKSRRCRNLSQSEISETDFSMGVSLEVSLRDIEASDGSVWNVLGLICNSWVKTIWNASLQIQC